MSMREKYALVTGGASGIGLECAKLFLEEGAAKCAIIDVDPSTIRSAKTEIAACFGEDRIMVEQCNVADKEEFENVIKKVIKNFGSLDVLVQSAGIANELDWEKTFRVNLFGTFSGMKLAMKYMGKENGGSGGTVINVASIAGIEPVYIFPAYASSKSGLINATRALGAPFYLEKTGVRVMAICPGATATPILNVLIQPEDMKEEFERALKGRMALQEPIDVAKAIIQILDQGENGSVWVCEKGEPLYEVIFQQRKEMHKTIIE